MWTKILQQNICRNKCSLICGYGGLEIQKLHNFYSIWTVAQSCCHPCCISEIHFIIILCSWSNTNDNDKVSVSWKRRKDVGKVSFMRIIAVSLCHKYCLARTLSYTLYSIQYTNYTYLEFKSKAEKDSNKYKLWSWKKQHHSVDIKVE